MELFSAFSSPLVLGLVALLTIIFFFFPHVSGVLVESLHAFAETYNNVYKEDGEIEGEDEEKTHAAAT
jgi:hypothetical protein